MMEKASSEALHSVNSSFSAMNEWVEGYKDPIMALTSNTIPAQIFIAIGAGLGDCGSFLADDEAKKLVNTVNVTNKSHK